MQIKVPSYERIFASIVVRLETILIIFNKST